MRVLILGGGRFTGRHLARKLVAAGAEVTTFQRHPTTVDGARFIEGDRNRDDGLDALRGLRFDAVVDFSAYESSWVKRTIDILAPSVSRYLFISSSVVYSPTPRLPVSESAPARGNASWGTYAREKVAAEDLLRCAHDQGRLEVALVRLPFVLGPGNYADREAFILSRLQARTEILLPGGGRAINQYVHVEDAADGILAILARPAESAGLAFNVACPGGITNRGLVEAFAEVSGTEALIRSTPSQIGTPGFVVDLSDPVFPFPDHHLVLDTRRAESLLGFTARRTVNQMVGDFFAWWEKDPQPRRQYKAEEAARII